MNTQDTSKPHAVVTGGAGFVGSHLVDALLDDGYRVTSLDNFGSGQSRNLTHLDEEDFISIEHDVRKSFPDIDRVDQVYHLASRASPQEFATNALEIALTNSEGSYHAFECAREHDAPVILASTSEVYGDPTEHPQHEAYHGNVNPRGRRAPYNEGKRFAEALAIAHEQEYATDIRTIRIFNTYGPRMRADDGRVIPTFITQALEGKDLTIFGDGTQTRSFCHVSDLLTGIRAVAESDPATVAGEVFNLGNAEEIQIRDLARLIIDLADSESGLIHEARPEDDPQVRRPDLTKARRLLDYQPEIGLTEGLNRTIHDFKSRARVT